MSDALQATAAVGIHKPRRSSADLADLSALNLRPVMVRPDAAALLMGVSTDHLHTLRSAGKAPPETKLGALVLFAVADIEFWAANGCPDRAAFARLRADAERRAKK